MSAAIRSTLAEALEGLTVVETEGAQAAIASAAEVWRYFFMKRILNRSGRFLGLREMSAVRGVKSGVNLVEGVDGAGHG